ncbi:Phosphatase tensin type [Penicillium nucicola]|uniref:Phosphatase tensin type n=1 Tax=Penicillium nucicola TaxID=1850975 RepID=UPI0025456C25|nr:Phosphatase tensin type [Penicillium nucicola]KAJ5753452.1 Phosphatase tensin type [Penicillium nucicola]
MSSILRQIVAGPRLQHPEAGLDLCYVTDNVIATSGPSATYPQRAYRNPLDALVNFLDSKHDEDWCIWEFRAEGTGYPDSEVYGRIHHFPWPDHHPPPFALIPNIMGSMRNWIQRLDDTDTNGVDTDKNKENQVEKGPGPGQRVAVVHCKAGKGRSGTVACSYLISQEGWKKEDALQRFTERRMRVGFGHGVSIPSQLRYVGYVDRWTNQMEKQYVERPVEILEVHIWGLKDGVKVAVEGYEDEGKKIKCVHLFHRSERTIIADCDSAPETEADSPTGKPLPAAATWSPATSGSQSDVSGTGATATGQRLPAIIFRPSKPVIVPSSDVNIDLERRSKASYTGFAMVTSIAHVWFNAYFEGGADHDSGVFETEWSAMDGIKGSARKGIRALDKLKVVWRYPPPESMDPGATASATGDSKGKSVDTSASAEGRSISEPKPGDPVPESEPADWRGQVNKEKKDLSETSSVKSASAIVSGKAKGMAHALEKELGLRKQGDESKDVSLAGSEDEMGFTTDEEGNKVKTKTSAEDLKGVKTDFGDGK